MFQFEFVAELLQFRLNGPEFVPLFTLPPEMTTDRAFLYPLCSLRVTFICDRHLCRLQNFAGERAPGMHVLRFLCRKLRGRKVPRSPLKWSLSSLRATAEAPVRARSRVVAEPVERTRDRPAAHATTRDDHFSAFGGIIVIAEIGVAGRSVFCADFNFRPFRIETECFHIAFGGTCYISDFEI